MAAMTSAVPVFRPELKNKEVIQVQKLMGLSAPHSNYFGVSLRFRRSFARVIMLNEASAHKFQPKFLLNGMPKVFHKENKTKVKKCDTAVHQRGIWS